MESVKLIETEKEVDERERTIETHENRLHSVPLAKHESLDFDKSDVSDYDDNSIIFEQNEQLENSDGIRLPRHITEVTHEQQQQIIEQYFDMNCDFCDTIFKSFDDAISHYGAHHKDKSKGYVRCCQLKFTVRSFYNWHIVWHLNPDLFK